MNTVCVPILGAVKNLVLLHADLVGDEAADVFEPMQLLWKHMENVPLTHPLAI